MKFKGLTKLALSGVALAAVAATLGTSTYAWYISNTTATVDGVNGTTAGADTSGSLYAASPSMYHNGEWSNKVTLTPGSQENIDAYAADYLTPVALNPVTEASAAKKSAYDTATSTSTSVNSGYADKEGKAVTQADGAYIQFSFYLIQRGDAPRQVNPKLTITNKTDADDLKPQTAYSTTSLPTTTAAGSAISPALKLKDTFAVDAVHALRVKIENSAAYSATTTQGETKVVDTTKKVEDKVYDADRDFETYTTLANTVYGGDANLYYNSVVQGVNLYGCDPVSTEKTNLAKSVANGTTASKWAPFWLEHDTETLVTFTIWLEGTDADCFDSCVNQAFDFKFEFELTNTKA